MPDTLSCLLAELPSAEPAPARAERTRARCRVQMERHTRPAPRVNTQPGRTGQLWQPLAAVLGVAYMTEAIVEALRFLGLFVD